MSEFPGNCASMDNGACLASATYVDDEKLRVAEELINNAPISLHDAPTSIDSDEDELEVCVVDGGDDSFTTVTDTDSQFCLLEEAETPANPEAPATTVWTLDPDVFVDVPDLPVIETCTSGTTEELLQRLEQESDTAVNEELSQPTLSGVSLTFLE